MGRRLFTFLAAISLLLCAVTCALWVRSYRLRDTQYREVRQYRPANERSETSIASNSGRLYVRRVLRIYNAKMYGGAEPPYRSTRRGCPGDRVVITLYDLLGPGEETIANQPIPSNGNIRLPYLLPIRAQGRTADLIGEAIHDGYAEAGLIQDASVAVAFAEARETDPPSIVSGLASSTSWALARGRPTDVLLPPTIYGIPVPALFVSHWRRLGFEFDSIGQSVPTHYRQEWQISFPHWIAAVLFVALPGFRLLAPIRRRLRKRANCCTACGYDLRATPDRCPECGMATALSRP